MKQRIRIHVFPSGGLSLWQAWRLYRAALRLRRAIEYRGYEAVAEILQRLAEEPGSDVVVRTEDMDHG